jgi:hypothetical protein
VAVSGDPPYVTPFYPKTISAGPAYRKPRPALNRVYFARTQKQANKWKSLLLPKQQILVRQTDIRRKALIALFYLGRHSAVTILSATVSDGALHLSILLVPPLSDTAAVGVYDIAAIDNAEILGEVRRVVVDQERDAPAPAQDASFYSQELGVPVRVDPGLQLELTPDVVYDFVAPSAVATPAFPENKIAALERPRTFHRDFRRPFDRRSVGLHWVSGRSN